MALRDRTNTKDRRETHGRGRERVMEMKDWRTTGWNARRSGEERWKGRTEPRH